MPKVTPELSADARQEEYNKMKTVLKAELKKVPRMKNIGKWITALSCGTLSMFTCCMCCGGCFGSVRGPDMACDLDVFEGKDYNTLAPDEKRIVNVTSWCGAAAIAMKCLPCLGCCCGCCGVISPNEAAACIALSKK